MHDRVVILTRSHEDNVDLAVELRARGVTVIELPSATIEPLADDTALAAEIRALGPDDSLVFTSRAGVDAASRPVRAHEVRATVAAVGAATARRCRDWGIDAWIPSEATGAALGRELPLGSGVVLLARADRAESGLIRELAARGARVREIAAYRVVPAARGDVEAARRAALEGAVTVVASPAAVEGLIAAIGATAFECARILAIGPTTARAAARAGVEPRVVSALTAGAIVREMEERDVGDR